MGLWLKIKLLKKRRECIYKYLVYTLQKRKILKIEIFQTWKQIRINLGRK